MKSSGLPVIITIGVIGGGIYLFRDKLKPLIKKITGKSVGGLLGLETVPSKPGIHPDDPLPMSEDNSKKAAMKPVMGTVTIDEANIKIKKVAT
jgi:hypothetical protein